GWETAGLCRTFLRGCCESTREIPVGQSHTFGALRKNRCAVFVDCTGSSGTSKSTGWKCVWTARIACRELAFKFLICSRARFPHGNHRKCRKSAGSRQLITFLGECSAMSDKRVPFSWMMLLLATFLIVPNATAQKSEAAAEQTTYLLCGRLIDG